MVKYLDGKEYKSDKALCVEKGIPYAEFRLKKKQGMTYEELFNYYLTDNHRGFYVNGRVYNSLSAACSEYNLPYHLIYSRISGVITGAKFLKAASLPIPSVFFQMITTNEFNRLMPAEQKRYRVCDDLGLWYTSKEALKFFSVSDLRAKPVVVSQTIQESEQESDKEDIYLNCY